MKLHSEFQGVRIDAGELYRDPEFAVWLNDRTRNQATWHLKGQPPGDFSDIFMIIDHGSGSDEDMPEHCWEQLLAFLKASGYDPEHSALVVWLANVPIDGDFQRNPEESNAAHAGA